MLPDTNCIRKSRPRELYIQVLTLPLSVTLKEILKLPRSVLLSREQEVQDKTFMFPMVLCESHILFPLWPWPTSGLLGAQ